MPQRLQKILSAHGVASRRKSEELIASGRVKVNGSVASIGQSADADKDIIEVDGKRLKPQAKLYFALYKPKGYVSTVADKFALRKVTDLVREKVYPVGRLDADAEGLLIMTNDGDFANRVMHPRYGVEKVYVVKLERPISRADLESLGKGIVIDGVRTFARGKFLSADRLHVEIVVQEGRHKIVKRIFRELGSYVRHLVRTRIGPVTLSGLRPGRYRPLGVAEIGFFNGRGSQRLQKGDQGFVQE